jgi:hypothetical protein
MSQKLTLVGISQSKGTFKREDGQAFDYDNTVFHCLVPLEKGIGHTVESYKMKGSQNYARFVSLAAQLPCDVELDFAITKRGNTVRADLVSVEPV